MTLQNQTMEKFINKIYLVSTQKENILYIILAFILLPMLHILHVNMMNDTNKQKLLYIKNILRIYKYFIRISNYNCYNYVHFKTNLPLFL